MSTLLYGSLTASGCIPPAAPRGGKTLSVKSNSCPVHTAIPLIRPLHPPTSAFCHIRCSINIYEIDERLSERMKERTNQTLKEPSGSQNSIITGVGLTFPHGQQTLTRPGFRLSVRLHSLSLPAAGGGQGLRSSHQAPCPAHWSPVASAPWD